jgi:phosphatidylethanolamine-binding protein (PEBP) family uncharacterized protein
VKRFATGVLFVAVAVAGFTACRDDGRTLRDPKPDQTLSITTTSSTVAKVTNGATVQPAAGKTALPGSPTLSAAWVEGGAIPVDLTCRGGSLSPALSWTNVPGEISELALSIIDLDNGQAVHWIVAGLDPALTAISKGIVPAGGVQAKNYLGANAWAPPCPNSGTHRFLVTLYFLPRASGVLPSMDGAFALDTLDLAAANRVTLMGTVSA